MVEERLKRPLKSLYSNKYTTHLTNSKNAVVRRVLVVKEHEIRDSNAGSRIFGASR